MNHPSRAVLVGVVLASLARAQATFAAAPNGLGGNDPRGQRRANGRAPNILFIIMDDVGIDQIRVFGYDLAAKCISNK